MSRARDNADLGDSYGSLAVGVTGGSGLTALGTVTAGNLSNTAIVYPAGHVIQTVFHKLASGDSGGQPSCTVSDANPANKAFTSMSTPFKKAITPVKNNSDILIMYQLSMGSEYTGGRHLYFRLYDNTNTSVIGTEGGHGLFGHYTTSADGIGSDTSHWNISGSYLYENPTIASTPNSIEIEVKFLINNAGNTMYLNRRGGGTTYGALTSTLTLLEIAR